MPTRSPTRCRQCRKLHHDTGLCATCKRQRYLDYRWVYADPRWAELRDQVLSEQPLCADCRAVPSQDIDHVIPLTVSPRLAFTRSNVCGLCKPCHGRKTRREG